MVLQEPDGAHDPVTVAVLDLGRHSSLMLPGAASDSWLRYSYGDWAFYAERRTGLLQGITSLLLPTRAALGRQVFTGRDPRRALDTQLRVPLQDYHPLTVRRARVDALRGSLEGIWEAQADQAHTLSRWDMAFVEHPEPYTLRNNSNCMVARWLQGLGVGVSRFPIFSNWRVKPADHHGGHRDHREKRSTVRGEDGKWALKVALQCPPTLNPPTTVPPHPE